MQNIILQPPKIDLTIIQNKIYEVRGRKVMFDFDLAERYGIETAQLKRAVKRNIERFEGEDFMFVATREELSRCQIGILNKGRGSNIKYLPFAFTDLGVAMLSSVLGSKTAIEVNRGIMRAFIDEVFEDYNDINEDTRIQLELINETLAELQSKNKMIDKPRRPIGFAIGQNTNTDYSRSTEE